MLMIWEAYLENDSVAQDTNNYDEQELESAMQQILLNSHDDYDDYDPFGHNDADGNGDIKTGESIATGTTRDGTPKATKTPKTEYEPRFRTAAVTR
jgi:hypothetical protein